MRKNVNLPLGLGILVLPIVFAWFTLREGYSKTARLVSFAWLILTILVFFVVEDPKPTESAVEKAKVETPENITKPSAINTKEQLAQALTAIENEQKVISAAWNNEGLYPSLLAGVRDDGTRRDGYAEYLCTVLADFNIKNATVRVMDNNKTEWTELGKATCLSPKNP